jgi:hypothetical protein
MAVLPRGCGVFEIGASRNSSRDRVYAQKTCIGICQDHKKYLRRNDF